MVYVDIVKQWVWNCPNCNVHNTEESSCEDNEVECWQCKEIFYVSNAVDIDDLDY